MSTQINRLMALGMITLHNYPTNQLSFYFVSQEWSHSMSSEETDKSSMVSPFSCSWNTPDSVVEPPDNFLFLDFDVHVLKQLHFSCVSPKSSFLYFTRRFWNQILTCFSDKFRYVAISILLSLDRYMLVLNSLSSSRSWLLVKAVRIRLLLLISSVELVTPVT